MKNILSFLDWLVDLITGKQQRDEAQAHHARLMAELEKHGLHGFTFIEVDHNRAEYF